MSITPIIHNKTLTTFGSTTAITTLTTIHPPSSGSHYIDAGFRANDLNPISGSLIWGSGSLFDNSITSIVTPAIDSNWSVGIRLKASGSFVNIKLFDVGTMPGWYCSGSRSSADVYTSGAPDVWKRYKTVVRPLRLQYSGSVYVTEFTFPTPSYGQYAKIHWWNGAPMDPIGNLIRVSKIQVREFVNTSAASGSKLPEYLPVYTSTLPAGVTQRNISLGAQIQ